MPEGDTVYATAKRLTEALGGVTLVRGELRHPRLSTVDFAGRVLVRAVSVGKHLFIRFADDVSFHCHLGMDGSWRVYSRRPPLNHRTRAIFEGPQRIAVGQSLVEMALLSTSDEKKLVAHLGPDLLAPDWSDAHLTEAVRRLTAEPEREIGAALLDQKVLAGLGNIYKAELCFLLGVSPWSPVSSADPGKTVELARKLLLRNALSPVRNTTGDPRRGRDLWVYGAERRGCLRCGGRIVVARQETRVAYYCPHCQPGAGPRFS